MSLATPLTRAARFLSARFDVKAASIDGGEWSERRLSELRGMFEDDEAVEQILANDDPLVYSVSTVTPEDGEGDLHYGLGRIMPGRVGREYFMTRGHLHFWRPAAELYIGLGGSGVLLMEDEETRESRVVPLDEGGIAYVPGHTAHRTINTGNAPLLYLGVYPARAGHDYAAIAERGFAMRVIAGAENGWEAVRGR